MAAYSQTATVFMGSREAREGICSPTANSGRMYKCTHLHILVKRKNGQGLRKLATLAAREAFGTSPAMIVSGEVVGVSWKGCEDCRPTLRCDVQFCTDANV